MAHLAELDGLRGLAVIAVILYHAGVLAGGFIGVEVFFVISGYLITSLLVDEWRGGRRIDVTEFWRRRARRLLPASTSVIVVTLVIVAVFLPEEVASTRSSAAAGLLSIGNWYAVFAHQSYFESVGRPPLLRHLWSLSIEAQFYLVWPLLLVAGLRYLRLRWVAVVAIAAAAASALLMLLLFQPGEDASRLYYGTDTRASGLLLGAALALSGLRVQRGGRVGDGAGFVALCVLAVTAYRLNEFDPLLYRGGLLAVGLLTVVVIAMGVRALSWGPMRWIGVRSYSIYLWHWPVFMLTRPHLDVPLEGVPLLGLQLAAIGSLAALSYRYIEMPFRSGRLHVKVGLRWAAVGGSVFTAFVLLGASAVGATPAARPAYLPIDQIDTWQAAAPLEDTPVADEPSPTPDVSPPAYVVAETEPTAPTRPERVRVTAIGDSVMLGAATALSQAIDGIEIDAAISRQAATFIEILRARAAARELGDIMVVHVGNNGPLSSVQFDSMMEVLAPIGRVVFVTVKVPRAWEAPNNAVLRDGVRRYATAELADWQAESSSEPALFWDDGIHLRPEGAALYAELIATHAMQ